MAASASDQGCRGEDEERGRCRGHNECGGTQIVCRRPNATIPRSLPQILQPPGCLLFLVREFNILHNVLGFNSRAGPMHTPAFNASHEKESHHVYNW